MEKRKEKLGGKRKVVKKKGQMEEGLLAIIPHILAPAALQLIGFSPYYTHCKRLKYHSGRVCVCVVLYIKGKQKEGSKSL